MLQHNLNRLFNAKLAENNIKGTDTNAAINKYVPILGIVDPATLLQLTDQVLTFKVCKQGSNGAAVGYIQYKVGAIIDRRFRPITAKKVKEFQKSKTLTPNGIVDSVTWTKLVNKKCLK